jgi:hypothetical protein
MRTIVAGAWCVAVAAGVGEVEGQGTVGHTVTDSAGIQIVTSHAPRWSSEQVWHVSERPTLSIGEVDGPPERLFGSIVAVGWLSDGRIFVADQQAREFRFFSAHGEYVETVGRYGNGPGEFRGIGLVERYRGDSMYVYDYYLRRVSVVGPEPSFVRSFRIPLVEGNFHVGGALADGWFVQYSPEPHRVAGGPGIVPDTSLIIAVSPDGSRADTIGAFEFTQVHLGPSGSTLPLYLQPVGTLAATGDHIVWTEGGDFEYLEAGGDGTVRRIVRKEHEPVAVTDDIIAEFKAWELRRLGEERAAPSLVARLRRAMEEGEYYHQLPATSEIKIDVLGNVWVGRYHFSGAATLEWEVFDPTGVWLGTVETPPGLEVHQIGRERIIGVEKDELGVPFVHVHRLDRR